MTKSRGLIAPRRAWSDFELAVMRLHYPSTLAADLAELFNRPVYSVYGKAKKLGLEKSPEFLASPASGRTGFDDRGTGGQFRPGLVPANKGKKYAATCKGQRATCTAGPEHAVRALARKVFGEQPTELAFVSRRGVIEHWRITA